MRNIYSETNRQNFYRLHKFILACVLVTITLFSGVIFSACGDKHKDLNIKVFSADGEIIEVLNLVIDPSQESSYQKIGIEFSGIKKNDIGQVKVYSEPYGLITDTNYSYNGNMCYVDINPIMQSSGDAKLIVSHLASNKTHEINLTIKKKSTDVEIVNSKYIISIPDEGENIHEINFAKLVKLLPDNMVPGVGTDDLYFKISNGLPDGVQTVKSQGESLGEVYSGFKVDASVVESTDDSCVKIYPVASMNGIVEDEDKYAHKLISVYFKKTLNEGNVQLVQKDEVAVELNNLRLIANDNKLNTFKLTLKHEETPLLDTSFFDMYKLEVYSHDNQKVSAFIDSNYDIIIMANIHTDTLIDVDVNLVPINYVGDFETITKTVSVKGDLKADGIEVKKNGTVVDLEKAINIFDYYEEGNALGALFTFKPYSFSGIEVHPYLNKMQIIVAPDILSQDNCAESAESLFNNYGVKINDRLYLLAIHLFNEPLMFSYDENSRNMVSQPITQTDRIYVKYIQGNGTEESPDFGFSIKTLNESQTQNIELLGNWANIEPAHAHINFNRLEGVKSLSYSVGDYEISNGQVSDSTPHGTNPANIYLDRLKGVQAGVSTIYYLKIVDGSVLGIDNSKVSFAEFEVEVTANFEATNPLLLFNKIVKNKTDGSSIVTLQYQLGQDAAEHNVISFVFTDNTDIGEYTINFYQEGIEKASFTCFVYEELTSIDDDVYLEQNSKVFANTTEYSELYPEADYVMAGGQSVDISVDLPQPVLDSNIVKGYSFSFSVGYYDGKVTPTLINFADFANYFEVSHDVDSLNHAKLTAVKGTFIDEKPQYVFLVVTAETKNFKNIVEEDIDHPNQTSKTISFFVYDEITKDDISINCTNTVMYNQQYLGVYYQDKATADLEITMEDSLWNYITMQYGKDAGDEAFVRWVVDGTEVEDYKNNQNVSLTFATVAGLSEYTRVVRAYVKQFESIFELQCVFDVRKPIVSERLRIKSELNLDVNDNYYINLKNGESYQVVAENYSSLGDVTHAETIIQVFDENGSAYSAREYFDVDQANNKITVKKVDEAHKFKLVVFAKDALKYVPSSEKSGYNNPQSFLMNHFVGAEQGLCDNAYFVMDIVLSNGTEENPYLIKSANDFWEIDDTEAFRNEDTYWQLMSNLTLDNEYDDNSPEDKKIINFNGHIITFNKVVFTIDGIILNNNNKTLFQNFGGNISNIKFVVQYDYTFKKTGSTSENLGLFDVNNGTLADVGVVLSGKAILDDINQSTTYYFGGLTAQNNAEIIYTKIEGVRGSIELAGDGKVYFGGLVGSNQGKIIGCEKHNAGGDDEIVLNTSTGRENVLSQISIYSELNNATTAIGGVVGYNTSATLGQTKSVGTIKNAFVQATIIAENASNVGGVIGQNKQDETKLTLTMQDGFIANVDNMLNTSWTDIAIYNVKSASMIKAKDNVGGIVGLDSNGVYVECDYQILSVDNKQVSIQAQNRVGGIAGYSQYGKFAYCSVMSYCWNYAELKTDYSKVVTGVADIQGNDYVGGIVGYADSTDSNKSPMLDGNNEIGAKTVVVYSSVNAYLQSKDASGKLCNIGGILSSEGNRNSVIFNAYFIGMLEGDVQYVVQVTGSNTIDEKIHHLALDNNGMATCNTVYSLNIERNANEYGAKLGHVDNGNVFKITDNAVVNGVWNPNREFWWGNVNINGGYLFITTDTVGENRLPIFDLAPDSIEVSVKEPKAKGLEKVLMLDYYDFSQNVSLTDLQLKELSDTYNRNSYVYKIDDKDPNNKENIGMLEFTAEPAGLGTIVLNVKSTNTNVIDVTFDGRLLINGTGECELIFNSVLNSKAEARIKVVVDYPIGDSLKISESKTDLNKIVNNQTVKIAKDTSRQLYVLTNGQIGHDFNEDGVDESYNYKTKNNLDLKIKITPPGSEIVDEYISISGKTGAVIDLDNKTPFIISVLKKLEEGMFDVQIIPRVIVNNVPVDLDKIVTFKLSTMAGATSITFSYDDAIVYPNDTVYVSANVITDNKFTDVNIDDIYNYIEIVNNDKYTYIRDFDDQKLYHIKDNKTGKQTEGFKIFVDDYSKYENNVQTIRFRIEFRDIELKEEAALKINAIVSVDGEYYVDDSVVYTIIPQRINKIEIKNYYKDADNKWILDNILKSSTAEKNNAGKMIIDIAPHNGYYSYLEISDITGDEEILFIQVDEDGNALSLSYDPSSDKKGIKLYHYEGQEKSRIYITTQIDRYYSSKVHTVEIRAYSNNGTLLHSQTKEIDVKMLPEILIDYILPDGYSNGGKITADNTSLNLFLANGVDANFLIETRNSNSDLEYSIKAFNLDGTENVELANKYQLVNIVGKHYVLQRKEHATMANDNGCKIRIDFKTYAYLDNGDFEVAECYIEFTLVRFVVHGISVNNSIDNSNTTEIYGYIGKPVELNFYFDKDDISFYDETSEGEKFWDTVYEYSEGIENNFTEGSVLKEIYTILKTLNHDDNNQYLILNDNQPYQGAVNLHYYNQIVTDKISLRNNNLDVKNDYNNDGEKYLAVEFRLNGKISDQSWTIDTFKATESSDFTYEVVKNYHLNFKNATAWYEPTVVHNEEDFMSMTSGGRYILAKDLVLRNYTPIDANLVEFDGNGRTITIQGFGSFNDVEIQAGLFRQIYEGMIVKNVVLKYESIRDNGNMTFGKVNDATDPYTDLCNNPNVNYTSLNFGGIAAVNNGIITNCSVQGVISINASTIEEKKFASGDNYGINFFVGGMVAENTETGYISNSTTELSVFAQANIGGFVHTNRGKIVSCGVEKNTTIYSYNNSLEKTIVINIAGFAVENKNHISMSYVKLSGLPFVCDYKDEMNDVFTSVEIKQGGTMSAKDTSAGFVYSNSGHVEDSYVNIAKTGVNNNTFSGFVYTNAGSITRAYSYINGGTKVDNNDTMFAPAGTKDLVDCIEFIVPKNGYNNGVEQGLATLDIAKRYNKACYQENRFAFGDNASAVWIINSGEMPILAIEQEKVEFKGSVDYDGLLPLIRYEELDEETGEKNITYKPNFAYYGTKENPFIISDLETWNEYFEDGSTSYYRIVKDLNFATLGDNPSTSKMTFRGNIQGNNMKLENVMLYSTSTLNSLGLFRDLSGVNDRKINNSVRNLTITTTSVWASRTSAVGLLAGVVENFNIYNINIDAQDVIIVGGNAVGGVAGIVRGEFDIDQITSNVGANSTRASTQYNYSIYMSKNNKRNISENLKNVYYAGSVVGVLDGYSKTNFVIGNARKLTDKYFMVRNVSVKDKVSIIGDSVGAAFGFVGERVFVDGVDVNISGMLAGVQYSAGVAGENRGVIANSNIIIADDAFVYSTNVSSGAVGLNLGGLVKDLNVHAKIHKSGHGKIVGGVVGRNIQGTVNNVVFDGELNAYFTGGIVGVSYTDDMLINATTGSGTIAAECKVNNTVLIPQTTVKYQEQVDGVLVAINNYENVAITKSTMEYFVNISKNFYSYQAPKEGEELTLSSLTNKIRVLGLVVGLSYEEKGIKEVVMTTDAGNYSINMTGEIVTFNSTEATNSMFVDNKEEVVLRDETDDALDIKLEMEDFVRLLISEGKDYILYLVGANVTTFDSWYNTYSDQYIVVRMSEN